ncbi:MAG: hypothetical protein WC123_06390 [Bacilli bacterium]
MTEANTMLREAENNVIVEGIVSEINLEVKDIQGKEAITGNLVIEIGETAICTVDVFANKFKKGTTDENSIFKGLSTVMNEYKSIAKVGKEEADKVRITGAKLTVNDYYNGADVLKSDVKVQTNFINRLKVGEEFNPRAEFAIEIFIHKMNDEVDSNGDVTGNKVISGLVPVYNGKIVPMEFIVKDQEIAQGIESLYEPGQSVKLYGDVNIAISTIKTLVPVAIGKPKEVIKTLTTRELIVTGGSEPYLEDNPNVFSIDTIKNAMTVREEMLAELKNKKDTKGNAGGKTASSTPKSGKTLPF